MKNILLLSALVIGLRTANAQYVSIPDSNFRLALKAKFPACFNANDKMDTTCSGILNAVSLNVNNKSISSIQGIQYFKKLFVLNCDSNNITTIPHINDTLYGLFCSHNRITSISTLPRNLKDLDCSYNQLTALPAIDKVSNSLDCSNNPSLSCLPTLFPSVFQGIKIRNTAITCFPNAFGGDADTTLPFCNSPCAFISDPFVTIPDSNFRVALKALYPACFDESDRMDTTCNGILNTNSLDVSRKNISSIDGIQYFKKLKTFYCNYNNLTRIAVLPNTISNLYCGNNAITQIDRLPDSLFQLECSWNQLSTLPAFPSLLFRAYVYNNKLTSLPTLPASINLLFCWDNLLTSLPVLPSSLYSLHCYNNLLTNLPTLPSSLNSLLCDNNQLTSLPSLPNSLNSLKCSNNQLTSIPTLPNNILQVFTCASNQLTSLPSLPSSLRILNYSNNRVTAFLTLPSALTELYCSNNQITSLSNLPSSLTTLDCSNNLISFISNLPSNLGTFYCGNNRLNALPFLPSKLDVIDCSNNRLTSVSNFSDSICYFNCSNNQLTSLPSSISFYRRIGFPNTRKSELICSGNAITCLPAFTKLDTLRIKNTSIRCSPFTIPISTFVDTVFAVCTSSCNVGAGYVTIPDSNFRMFLLQNYPSCMNVSQQLDTNCSSILNVGSINLNNKNIQSLEGIQYFKRLLALHCDSNRLNTLPILPNTLSSLFCSHNQITTLPNLPASLRELDCSNNLLTALPSISQISSLLNCSNNLQLNCLPTLATNFSQHIKIKNTGILCVPNDYTGISDTILPICNRPCAYDSTNFVTIPDVNFRMFLKNKYPACFNRIDKMDKTCSAVVNEDSLMIINKNINSIDGIQYFNRLFFLFCDSNKIESIASLPNSLGFITCSFNQLTNLPVLPVRLFYLKCNNNKLTSLSSIPGTVFYLDCQSNQLSSLQTAFRDSLTYLYCNNNPLSCLPFLPQYVSLFVKNTNISCLPNVVRAVDTILPICSNAANICPVNPFVTGKTYVDLNNNNFLDSVEQLIPQQIIKVLPNNWLGASNNNGIYIVKLDTAINNSWSAVNNYRYASITPTSYSLANIHNLGLQSGSYDFGIHFIPNVKDLETTLGSSPARPGFTTNVTVRANNVGTVNQSSITIKLKKPTDFSVLSTSILPTSIINDTLIWKNISINYLAHQSINIQLQVPVNAVLGDSAVYEAWSNGTQGDTTPLDNYTKWTEIIRGSFDPNDKLVNKETLPPTYNANKDRLLYTIRFQNTGSDTAFTVIVRDEIPTNLEVSSLRVVNASHTYQLIVREKNIVEVAFPNIQLPDSNANEAKSHGFVQLEFKPKAGLPVNAEINNNASIFFDYNAPIVTNTATTKIQITTGIANNKKLAFKLFPNPATSIITVELPFEGKGNWYLTDISGKSIQQNTIENNTKSFDINVNDVSSGAYLLMLEINGIISTSKVAILK